MMTATAASLRAGGSEPASEIEESSATGPQVFVTVGSTQFSALVGAMLSGPVIDALAEVSAPQTARLVIQYGATPLADILTSPHSALLRSSHAQQHQSAPQDPLGASGTLNVPMSALVPDSEQDREALHDTALSKTFRLNQRSLHDNVDDDDQEEEAPLIPHGQSKGRHFTFRVPATASAATSYQTSSPVVEVQLMDYVDSITPYLRSSSVVISHAGSGTILEALRIEPVEERPVLVVVPNEALMDNHQTELAAALAKLHHVVATRVVGEVGEENKLPSLLKALLTPDAGNAPNIVPFPAFQPGRFQSIVDGEMGFHD